MSIKRYKIEKRDILKRIYFITNLVQSQKSTTMHGALTSKSDSMGGIFDRFINTISDDLVFDKIILGQINTKKDVKTISDYYLYKPTKNGAGIAPDVFGLNVDGKTIPFVIFDERWKAVENTPQIEVKTFKEKDQMISLRDQGYEEKYLIMADMDLRIDYLVPFFDKELLTDEIFNQINMDDKTFIKSDSKNQIKSLEKIDFSSDIIGYLTLISITTAIDFMHQSTLCAGNVSVRRMKEITERKVLIKNYQADYLSNYANKSPRSENLFEFNDEWYNKTGIDKSKVLCLDFSATNLDDIEICKFNVSGIVISAKNDGCSFNEVTLEKGKQYTVLFDTLDRSGNGGSEYFMQKQCAIYLNDNSKKLIEELTKIVEDIAC